MGVLVIDDANLILNDMFPGVANDVIAFPPDLLELSDDANYPVGTKIRKYDPDNLGWSTFIYLKFVKGSTDVDLAAKAPVGVKSGGAYYEVCNDGGDILLNGPMAVALTSLDYGVVFTAGGKTHKYGWFWCGGVCPTGIVKSSNGTKVLDGNFACSTGSAVTVGNGLKLADVAGDAAALTAKAAADLTSAAATTLEAVTAT